MSTETTKEEIEKLKSEIDSKVRESLNEEGLAGLAVFTLENFAYRYLETENYKDILAQKVNDNHFFVESVELDPMKALKVKDKVAKAAVIELAKKYSQTKGVGLELKAQLHVKYSSLSSDGSGEVECFSILNWNKENNFQEEEGLFSKRVSRLEFDDPIILRNKLALLLEDVCEAF